MAVPGAMVAGAQTLDNMTGRPGSPMRSFLELGLDKYNTYTQDQLNRMSVQIRAEDARAAGVNVATAMGAPTMSAYSSQLPTDSGVDTGAAVMSALGQTVARFGDRDDENDQIVKLNIERGKLQNELLRSQISVLKQPSRQTSLPSANDSFGQGNAPNIEVDPSKMQASSRGDRAQQAGAINEYQYVRGADGVYRPVPSADVTQRIEDSMPMQVDWYMRNRLFTPPHPGPEVQLAPGTTWEKVFGGWVQRPYHGSSRQFRDFSDPETLKKRWRR